MNSKSVVVALSFLSIVASRSLVGDDSGDNGGDNDGGSNETITLINDAPLIRDSLNRTVPAIVLFENFIFDKFNVSNHDEELRSSNATTDDASYTAARFIQENLDNLYRNLNALNQFITKNKYGKN